MTHFQYVTSQIHSYIVNCHCSREIGRGAVEAKGEEERARASRTSESKYNTCKKIELCLGRTYRPNLALRDSTLSYPTLLPYRTTSIIIRYPSLPTPTHPPHPNLACQPLASRNCLSEIFVWAKTHVRQCRNRKIVRG